MFSAKQIEQLRKSADKHGITPGNCPNCEYDRRFPMTASGGWMDMGNNGPIMCCPVCNPDARHPRD